MRRLMRHRTAAALLIGVGVFEVLFGLRSAGFLESLELGAYDNLLRLRPTTAQKPVVTHVWVTEEEIRVLEEFLPQQLSADQIEEKVRAYLSAHPDIDQAGKLTGALKKELGDQADGKLLNEICRKVLE